MQKTPYSWQSEARSDLEKLFKRIQRNPKEWNAILVGNSDEEVYKICLYNHVRGDMVYVLERCISFVKHRRSTAYFQPERQSVLNRHIPFEDLKNHRWVSFSPDKIAFVGLYRLVHGTDCPVVAPE